VHFADRVAIVTGGGWGIGRATALHLARGGAAVVASDVEEDEGLEGAHEVVSRIRDGGGRAEAIAADAADEQDWNSLVAFAVETFGGLDVLVNNAGGHQPPNFPDTPPERWGRVLDVNLRGVMLGLQAALPALRRRGGGAIVNVASVAGTHYDSYDAPEYAAAKAGVVHLTTSLAWLHERDNVRVTCICPDWVATEAVVRTVEAMTPEERAAKVRGLVPVDEIAEAIASLAADETLAGRVLVRWADEQAARFLPYPHRE
jgi:NAD(P)-dependent dehydrogenase (short-subunit alcohol dehydrogenase family)